MLRMYAKRNGGVNVSAERVQKAEGKAGQDRLSGKPNQGALHKRRKTNLRNTIFYRCERKRRVSAFHWNTYNC